MKRIRTDDVFETGRFRRVWTFLEDFEADFGLKQNGWGYKGLLEIVEILLEKYWVLDSFGTNLGR